MTTVDVRVPEDGSIVNVEGLSLDEGRVTVLFGPNGAGKTTLLRALAGIGGTEPMLDGHYLPQRPYLFKGLAGWNLGLGLDAEEASWSAQMARALGVDELLSEPASQLSGGEVQRLALARALSAKSPWLLLDEPLAAIDHADRQRVLARIAAGLEGKSAVVVTHDVRVAAALGDEIAVIADGQMLQQGPIAEVLSTPVSLDVARVLGIQNLVSGIASARDGMTVVKSDSLEVVGSGRADGNARAVFAAEAVTVAPAGSGSGSARNRWTGAVTELKSMGNLIEVVVDVGQPVVAVVTPGAADELELAVGSSVDVACKATAVVVIPA